MPKKNTTSEKILAAAADALDAWEDGSTLDDCLDAMEEGDSRIKPAASSLLFEYFRHKGAVDGIIRRFARKGDVHKDVRIVAACAITQALYQTGIAAESAVNVAVDFTKNRYGHFRASFVNALLRAVLSSPEVKPAPGPSFPENLKKKWIGEFGEETAAKIIAEFASNPLPVFRMRSPLPEEQIAGFGAKKLVFDDFPFDFYEFADAKAFFAAKMPESGKVYVQDPATALSVSLAAKNCKEVFAGRILDACAAPGGKTLMLADLTSDKGAKITAADRSRQRCTLMNVNFRRAGVRCGVKQLAAQDPFFPKETFELILADVPCSNTGVIRRRPDAPWRYTSGRAAELVRLQKEIMDSLAPFVKKGGFLLYSTCSIENEEDSEQVRAFLERHEDFELTEEKILLPAGSHDGAYAALLRKKA